MMEIYLGISFETHGLSFETLLHYENMWILCHLRFEKKESNKDFTFLLPFFPK